MSTPSPPLRPDRNFQDLILVLQNYWAAQGCAVLQPYDMWMGAGTFHWATFLRSLGPDPWRCAYVQPCRRPTDGRYGENPNRLGHYYQYQVLMKPSPPDIQKLYLGSLEAIGLNLKEHDIRFVEDDWESPTLGAWGLGWEVWLDGMEVTQFTYFQQVAGMDCAPVSAELTYGLERLAMYLQGVENVYDLVWVSEPVRITYGDVYWRNEREQAADNFVTDQAAKDKMLKFFESNEQICQSLLVENEARGPHRHRLPLAAYDNLLICSHTFNMLQASGAISVAERAGYLKRVRDLAVKLAKTWTEMEEDRKLDHAAHQEQRRAEVSRG